MDAQSKEPCYTLPYITHLRYFRSASLRGQS